MNEVILSRRLQSGERTTDCEGSLAARSNYRFAVAEQAAKR